MARSQSQSVSPLPPADTLIAIDFETTGLVPRHDEVIELGAVKFSGSGEVLDTFEMLARPRQRISPDAQARHGITWAMVQDQLSPLEVWDRFVHWAGDCSFFVAHVAEFEARFIRALCEGKRDLARIRFMDTRRIARARLPNEPSYRLSDLVPELGAQGHRALPDAAACAELYVRLAGTYKSGKVPLKTYSTTIEEFGWFDAPTERQLAYIADLGGDPEHVATKEEASRYIDQLKEPPRRRPQQQRRPSHSTERTRTSPVAWLMLVIVAVVVAAIIWMKVAGSL